MSEKQKQLVEDILTASEKLPPERQYQLLGVAYGLELAQGMAVNTSEKQQQQN